MLTLTASAHKVQVIFGAYETENISLKNLVKIFIDDVDIQWCGFYPLDADEIHVFRQSRYTLLDQIQINVEDSFQVAQSLLNYIDNLMKAPFRNPVLEYCAPQYHFMSVLDVHQKAIIAAIIYKMKLYGEYSAVIGRKEFLSIEELIFLEDCLRLSPYLKTLGREITVEQLMVPFKIIYRQILNKRMHFESLMDLHPKVLAYVYQDMPEGLTIKQ